MKEIISVNNQLIKDVTALQTKKIRNETGLFLIEGYKGVFEAVKSNLHIEHVFFSVKFNKDMADFPIEKAYLVGENVMKKISTTESPPDIVAVARKFNFGPENIFINENPLVILLENVKDPGNLGTIIRTAAAASASGIILTDNTVDIYNPKTVRSSAANLWKIPIIYIPQKKQIKSIVKDFCNCDFIATTVKKDLKNFNVYECGYELPAVVMFGSEAEGLSPELLDQADYSMSIPMNKNVESLNLSISVGVVLYEALRQRSYRTKKAF